MNILSRSDINSLSTGNLKTLFATNIFALSLPSFSLVALLLTVCPSSIKIRAYPPRTWLPRASTLVHCFPPARKTGFIYLSAVKLFVKWRILLNCPVASECCPCCCGQAPARFVICSIAVVKLLLVL